MSRQGSIVRKHYHNDYNVGMKPWLTMMCMVVLSACAGMPAGDDRSLAERDHQHCTDTGHEFPSNAYDGCRWRLQEARHRRTWENMRLMERSRLDGSGIPDHAHYRHLPREGFRCTEHELPGGYAWIDCQPRQR